MSEEKDVTSENLDLDLNPINVIGNTSAATEDDTPGRQIFGIISEGYIPNTTAATKDATTLTNPNKPDTSNKPIRHSKKREDNLGNKPTTLKHSSATSNKFKKIPDIYKHKFLNYTNETIPKLFEDIQKDMEPSGIKPGAQKKMLEEFDKEINAQNELCFQLESQYNKKKFNILKTKVKGISEKARTFIPILQQFQVFYGKMRELRLDFEYTIEEKKKSGNYEEINIQNDLEKFNKIYEFLWKITYDNLSPKYNNCLRSNSELNNCYSMCRI